MIVAGIDHIVLRTANVSGMLAFYIDKLGLKIERQTSPETGLIQLRAGRALIDIVDVNSSLGQAGGGAPGKTENNLDHFCLLLEPISNETLADTLMQNGIEPGDFARRYGSQGFGDSIYIKDPDGNVVELRSQR